MTREQTDAERVAAQAVDQGWPPTIAAADVLHTVNAILRGVNRAAA